MVSNWAALLISVCAVVGLGLILTALVKGGGGKFSEAYEAIPRREEKVG